MRRGEVFLAKCGLRKFGGFGEVFVIYIMGFARSSSMKFEVFGGNATFFSN